MGWGWGNGYMEGLDGRVDEIEGRGVVVQQRKEQLSE